MKRARHQCGRSENGAVLVFVLWTLTFLMILTVQVGYTIRQKIILLKQLEERSQLNYVAEAGIKKAVSFLSTDLEKNQFIYTAEAKKARHNNPSLFSSIRLGPHAAEVRYDYPNIGQSFYGVLDEESKLNLNTADLFMLQRLMIVALGYSEDDALELAESIYDWREFGDSRTEGFLSQSYYSTLQDPYEAKSDVYELLDELLLVKGVDQDLFSRLAPYLTVYGNGVVNINTAPYEVLVALGLGSEVAHKVLLVRAGKDGIHNTTDDYLFYKTFDVASEVNQIMPLKPEEMRQIDTLNQKGLMGVNSYYFFIQSTARLNDSSRSQTVQCVFSTLTNRFEFWKEK